MQVSLKNRLARLEATQHPPAGVWTIPIEIVEMDMETGARGRVVGHIPARLIQPGERFDYRTEMEQFAAAMDGIYEEL